MNNTNTAQPIVVSLLTIGVGVAWLLNKMAIVPGVNWVWIAALAATGMVILALSGLNKLTVVTGPFLIVAAAMSYMRQTGQMNLDHEVPILVIVLGVLMLFAAATKIPSPAWMQPPMPVPQKR